jgi:hypothetical protein
LFVIAASFALALPGHSQSVALSVDAQTPMSLDSALTNDLAAVSSRSSFVSTLLAQGCARVAEKALQDAPVSLHILHSSVAHTITGQNGLYSFSAPVGLYYFPAVVSRDASVYTVVEPSSASFASTSSATIGVSVDNLPLYVALGIAAVMILLAITLLVRRRRRKHAAGESAGKYGKETSVPVGSTLVSPSAYSAARGVYVEALPTAPVRPVFAPEGAGDLVNQARALFAQGNDRAAVNALYDAALASLAVAPDARAPLRTLIAIYDRANFSATPLDKQQQDTAIEAFRMIESRRESVGREEELDLVNQAHALFAQGNDRAAVNALYDAALASLAVAPDAGAPLRTLIAIYDRANFSAAPLDKQQQDTAIEAFRMIESRRESVRSATPLDKQQQGVAIEAFRMIESRRESVGREEELDLVNQARALFAQGNDRAAVNALYDAALTSLSDAHSLILERDLTHLERYLIVEAAVPEAREPVRTLTKVYELANYSGKRLRTEQRNAAISAYEWIEAHIRSLKKSE